MTILAARRPAPSPAPASNAWWRKSRACGVSALGRAPLGDRICTGDGADCHLSQAQAALSTERPIDAAIATGDARDMLAEIALQRWRPGHELKAQSIVDHGGAAGGEHKLAVSLRDRAVGFAEAPAASHLPALLRSQVPEAASERPWHGA